MDDLETRADMIDTIEDAEERLLMREAAQIADETIDRHALLIQALTDIQLSLEDRGIYKTLDQIRANIKDPETLELLLDMRALLNYTQSIVNKTQR